jgi:hypothetical protein
MRKVLAGCVVVLVAVVAVQFASSATSRSSKSIPGRVKALEAKVKVLSASVKTLKSDVAALATRANCLAAQGVVLHGNPTASQGYLYTPDGTNVGIVTALDAPATGQTPTFYVATVNPACITGSRSAFRLGHVVSPHTTATFPAP